MTAEEIKQFFSELNDELRQMGVKGEISLFGGAVMVLAFDARPATRHIDAIFKPVKEIRNDSHRIAERHGLRLDWLNLAVKMFVVEHSREVLFEFSNLTITVPDAKYLLAMKLFDRIRRTKAMRNFSSTNCVSRALRIRSISSRLSIRKKR